MALRGRMSWISETRPTLKLAIPLMIGQLSQMLLGVADTAMIGNLGVLPMAALTFANSLFHIPFVFGIGLLSAVSVFTANARGADDAEAACASCRHGVYLATALGILLFTGCCLLSYRLEIFHQPEEVRAITGSYFRIIMASMLPALISLALKNHADALNRPWVPFWIFLGGVALNVVLNWIMIYGKFGCPALGMDGAAWATLISRWVIVFALLGWMCGSRSLEKWVPQNWFRKPVAADFSRLLSIGFPASIHMLFEVSTFSVAGLLIGKFGAVPMAAHQVAITLSATAFMIPMGLSMALSVRTGEAYGAGDFQRIKAITISGWVLCCFLSALSAAAFIGLGRGLAACFTNVPEVILLASSMLVIVGIFQLVDGLQVASSAIMRGIHEARFPAWMGFISYWIIGIPVGALLAYQTELEARGVWWGMAIGLAVACFTIGGRLWQRLGKSG